MKTLIVKPSRNGQGAFAGEEILVGETIADWSDCFRCSLEEIPAPYLEDRYLQVAPDLFIYGAGEKDPDDYINHSCSPNSAVLVTLPRIRLVALRKITPGQEITFDYAATMSHDPWQMLCNCGAKNCRGVVRSPIY